MMELEKKERQEIEKEGVLYVIASIITAWREETENMDIELVTDKETQIKGVDYILKLGAEEIYIDSKFHRAIMSKQRKDIRILSDEYGCVPWLSIEVTKANGSEGWGRNEHLKTDYIIDMIKDNGYYVIDAYKLREYMAENYKRYEVAFKSKGKEDYRAVPVKDLMDNDIILFYEPWGAITSLVNILRDSSWYKNNIEPNLNKLIY